MRSRLGALTSVAALMTLLVAGPAGAAGGSSPPSDATLVATSAHGGGCGQDAPPGSSTLTFSAGGPTRIVIVHIPTGYSGTVKVPLVLDLHGSGSTAAQQEAFSGMDAEADAAGFIVVYPQGFIDSGTGFDWNVPGEPLPKGDARVKNPPDDLAFLSELVTGLQERYCIAPGKIYATGFSGGARMSSELACDDSNIFAAVAPVSGLRHPTPCPSVRAVPIVAFSGTEDPVDPYEGHGQPYWTYSVPRAARDWAAQDDCSLRPHTSTPVSGVVLTRYSGCPGHAAVELYTIEGEGHEWPGGPEMPPAVTKVFGPQTTAVNADALMWAFFSAHRL